MYIRLDITTNLVTVPLVRKLFLSTIGTFARFVVSGIHSSSAFRLIGLILTISWRFSYLGDRSKHHTAGRSGNRCLLSCRRGVVHQCVRVL